MECSLFENDKEQRCHWPQDSRVKVQYLAENLQIQSSITTICNVQISNKTTCMYYCNSDFSYSVLFSFIWIKKYNIVSISCMIYFTSIKSLVLKNSLENWIEA